MMWWSAAATGFGCTSEGYPSVGRRGRKRKITSIGNSTLLVIKNRAGIACLYMELRKKTRETVQASFVALEVVEMATHTVVVVGGYKENSLEQYYGRKYLVKVVAGFDVRVEAQQDL